MSQDTSVHARKNAKGKSLYLNSLRSNLLGWVPSIEAPESKKGSYCRSPSLMVAHVRRKGAVQSPSFCTIGMLGFAIGKTVLHLGLYGQEVGAASWCGLVSWRWVLDEGVVQCDEVSQLKKWCQLNEWYQVMKWSQLWGGTNWYCFACWRGAVNWWGDVS